MNCCRISDWRDGCLLGRQGEVLEEKLSDGNTQRDQGHESRDQEGRVEGAPSRAYSMSKGDKGKERRGHSGDP